jgi:hypothetical protein
MDKSPSPVKSSTKQKSRRTPEWNARTSRRRKTPDISDFHQPIGMGLFPSDATAKEPGMVPSAAPSAAPEPGMVPMTREPGMVPSAAPEPGMVPRTQEPGMVPTEVEVEEMIVELREFNSKVEGIQPVCTEEVHELSSTSENEMEYESREKGSDKLPMLTLKNFVKFEEMFRNRAIGVKGMACQIILADRDI